MNKEFIQALEDLERDKGISKQLLIESIEVALLAAYKKNKGTTSNVHIEIDADTGEIEITYRKNVVEEVEDPETEIALEEVLQFDPDYVVGDVVEYPEPLENFGRIAAQTAKQVVVQRLREAERGMIFDEFTGRQSEIINGTIQRVSNDTVFVNLGRTEGILAKLEQVRGEHYSVNSRMKFYIMDVRKSMKGPQVYLSRSHPGLVKRLFELEVPEIQDGIVEIKSLAREAGSRTKMAVSTNDESIDPVGACVGNRGVRVQSVVDELFGEKIDIITWSDDAQENINSALSPSKVEKVILDEDENSAIAIVPDYQLSLAIGKEGQNVRLAAKLCGWKIDIKSHTQYYGEEEKEMEYDDSLITEEYYEGKDYEDGRYPADGTNEDVDSENVAAAVVEEKDDDGIDTMNTGKDFDVDEEENPIPRNDEPVDNSDPYIGDDGKSGSDSDEQLSDASPATADDVDADKVSKIVSTDEPEEVIDDEYLGGKGEE